VRRRRLRMSSVLTQTPAPQLARLTTHDFVGEADRSIRGKGRSTLTWALILTPLVAGTFIAIMAVAPDSGFVPVIFGLLTLLGCGVMWSGYSDYRRPGVLTWVQQTGPTSVNDVNAILSGATPAMPINGANSANDARLNAHWLVGKSKDRLVAIRPCDVVWVHVVDRSMSEGVDDVPIRFTVHSHNQTFQTDLTAVNGNHLTQQFLPLCPQAKFGYDKDLDNSFGINRTRALKKLAKKDFPTVASKFGGVSSTHVTNTPSQSPSNPVQTTNRAAVDGTKVIVTGDSDFPKICPCCGKPGTQQVKVQLIYRTPWQKAINVLGVVAILGGAFVRTGAKQAFLRPWVCDSCPGKKSAQNMALLVAQTVAGAATVLYLIGRIFADDFPHSLPSPKLIASALVLAAVSYWRDRMNVLQVGGIDNDSVTLLRTHSNFRAALPPQTVR
jgi:hypothetical protein